MTKNFVVALDFQNTLDQGFDSSPGGKIIYNQRIKQLLEELAKLAYIIPLSSNSEAELTQFSRETDIHFDAYKSNPSSIRAALTLKQSVELSPLTKTAIKFDTAGVKAAELLLLCKQFNVSKGLTITIPTEDSEATRTRKIFDNVFVVDDDPENIKRIIAVGVKEENAYLTDAQQSPLEQCLERILATITAKIAKTDIGAKTPNTPKKTPALQQKAVYLQGSIFAGLDVEGTSSASKSAAEPSLFPALHSLRGA